MNILKLIASGALCALMLSANGAAPTDRVGFPANYRSTFKLLSVSTQEQEPVVMTAYGNELATSVKRSEQLPFPNGSIIVMEFANTLKDANGKPVRNARGALQPGEIVHVDVMRRGQGFGEAYGEHRAGEWEFASYRSDGSYYVTPEKSVECAACHAKVGAAKDFVFRLRTPQE